MSPDFCAAVLLEWTRELVYFIPAPDVLDHKSGGPSSTLASAMSGNPAKVELGPPGTILVRINLDTF